MNSLLGNNSLRRRRNNNRRNGNRRRGRRNVLSNNVGNHVVSPMIRSLYPPMPREMQFKLRYRQDEIAAAATGPYSQRYGLFSYLGHLPTYVTQLYNIYRYSMITAVHVNIQVINQSSEPLVTSMAVVPYDDANVSVIATPNDLARIPRSVSRLIGTSSGFSKGTLNRLYYSYDQLGQPVFDRTYWLDTSDAIATSPNDLNQPVIYVMTDAASGATWSGTISYVVDFHVKFFDLEYQDNSPPGSESFVDSMPTKTALSTRAAPFHPDTRDPSTSSTRKRK